MGGAFRIRVKGELYRAHVIDLETAKSAATSPSDFERNLQFI